MATFANTSAFTYSICRCTLKKELKRLTWKRVSLFFLKSLITLLHKKRVSTSALTLFSQFCNCGPTWARTRDFLIMSHNFSAKQTNSIYSKPLLNPM